MKAKISLELPFYVANGLSKRIKGPFGDGLYQYSDELTRSYSRCGPL